MRTTIDPTPTEAPVYAIVEQMGHRRFGARIREVSRFGTACMEATVLLPKPVVTYVFASSLFAVTVCDEAEARRANNRCTGLPLLDDGRDDDIPFGRYEDQRLPTDRDVTLERADAWLSEHPDNLSAATIADLVAAVRAGDDRVNDLADALDFIDDGEG